MYNRPRFRRDPSLEEIIRRAIAAPPSSRPPQRDRQWAVILAMVFGTVSVILFIVLLVVLTLPKTGTSVTAAPTPILQLPIAKPIPSPTPIPTYTQSALPSPTPSPTPTPHPTPTSLPTALPTPKPDPMHGLTVASAANLIIQYYDEQGPYASIQLIKQITSMTLPEPQEDQIVSCVGYENAELDYPEQVYGTWTRQFTLQYSAPVWAVISMGSEDCTVANGQTPPPQTPIGTPPALNQIASSIITFYDNDWNGFYVMDSIQNLLYRQQVANYVGACVYYTYHDPNYPNDPLYFHAEFGFAFKNGQWTADAWDQSGCGPNYNS